MTRILFVCHGNICRSPMAEFVMRSLVDTAGLRNQFIISSAATSTEELGNDIHPGAREKLDEEGIPHTGRSARQITRGDYDENDLLIGMDDENMRNMKRCFGGDPERKCHKLLEYCGLSRDVDDPWYSGDFDAAYTDIFSGCVALLNHLR